MKTNILSIIIAFLTVTSVYSQTNLNEYKYVIVPKQFSFLKSENEHRINELAQFLFKKHGFTAFMEGDKYPKDFFENRCATLRADVIKDPGMFRTKLTTVLKDCNDQVIYTSDIGESRAKEYGQAYNEALRNAFKSIKALHYKYDSTKSKSAVTKQSTTETNTAVATNEIEKLKEEIQTLKKQKEAEVTKIIEQKQDVVVPVKKEIIKVTETTAKSASITNNMPTVLYAQQTKNGYQLVDSSPKVIYKIQSTGLNNVYLVEGKNAIIYKKGDNWITEYYEGNTLKQDTLNIKF